MHTGPDCQHLIKYFHNHKEFLNTFQVPNSLRKRRLSSEIVLSIKKCKKLDELSNLPMRLRGGGDRPDDGKSENEVNMSIPYCLQSC